MEDMYIIEKGDNGYELTFGIDFEMYMFQFLIENAMQTHDYDIAMILPQYDEEEVKMGIGKVVNEQEFEIIDEFTLRRMNKQFVEFYGSEVVFQKDRTIAMQDYQDYLANIFLTIIEADNYDYDLEEILDSDYYHTKITFQEMPEFLAYFINGWLQE